MLRVNSQLSIPNSFLGNVRDAATFSFPKIIYRNLTEVVRLCIMCRTMVYLFLCELLCQYFYVLNEGVKCLRRRMSSMKCHTCAPRGSCMQLKCLLQRQCAVARLLRHSVSYVVYVCIFCSLADEGKPTVRLF